MKARQYGRRDKEVAYVIRGDKKYKVLSYDKAGNVKLQGQYAAFDTTVLDLVKNGYKLVIEEKDIRLTVEDSKM